MNSDSQKHEMEVPIIIGCTLIGIILLIILLPAIVVGLLLGAVFIGSLEKKTFEAKLRTTILAASLLFLSVLLFGIGERFEGAVFTDLKPLTFKLALVFVEWLNPHLPIKKQIRYIHPNYIRDYFWFTWMIAGAFFTAGYLDKIERKPNLFKLSQALLKPVLQALRYEYAPLLIGVLAAAVCFYFRLPIVFAAIVTSTSVINFYTEIERGLSKIIRFESKGADQGSVAFAKAAETGETVLLTPSQLNHHVHIVGASGFGKSVLLTHLIRHQINDQAGLLFIDLKADIETINEVRNVAELAGRKDDLQIFSCGNPELSSHYNVLKDGSANQIRDRLIMSFEWTEEFYKNECASALLKIVKGLVFIRDRDKKTFDLFDVHGLLADPSKLLPLATEIGDTEPTTKKLVFDLHQSLKDTTKLSYLQGLRSQIESLIYSDFGHLFEKSDKSINLFESIRDQKIVYVLLDSRRYGESSKALGKMILEDLKSTSARIDNEINREIRKPFAVIVDEFADMATDGFIGFLDRARSSKIGVVVAHQEVADLDRINPEFRRRLMNSTSTLFAFLQKDPESSELIAAMGGTKTSKAETERSEGGLFGDRMTGQKSIRITEEYVIHPNDIRSLRVGECVMVEKYPLSRSRKIVVDLPLPIRTETKSTAFAEMPKISSDSGCADSQIADVTHKDQNEKQTEVAPNYKPDKIPDISQEHGPLDV